MAETVDKSVTSGESADQTDATDNSQQFSGELDKSKLRYENGKCYYTDPNSGAEYVWDEEKKEWSQPDESATKDYHFDGETYFYTDKSSGVKYKWDKEDNKWNLNEDGKNPETTKVQRRESGKAKRKSGGEDEEEEEMDTDEEEEDKKEKEIVRQDMSRGTYGTDGSTLTYTDPADGTVYFWDKQKSAWFPKVDDEFLAHYQLSYGFVTPEDDNESKKKVEPEKPVPVPPSKETEADKKEEAEKRKLQEASWFEVEDSTNTKVYVSNLPTDITEQEFVDLMQKCGLVMKDPDNGKMKVKLYTEKGSDELKGDALCTYIKVESVELALNLLDGYDCRGHKIKVERAKFTMKGDSYDPSLKPKKKRRKDKDKLKKMQEKLFDWRPQKPIGDRAKHERVVIVKNLFDPKIFDKEVGLILEFQEDIREECRKCGVVRKVTIYDRHPEGVAQINFKEPEAADACVQLLNGRWFGQRQITAETWDGRTKFRIAETQAEIDERLNKWDNFLEGKDDGEKKKTNQEDVPKKPEEDAKIQGQGDATKIQEGEAEMKEDATKVQEDVSKVQEGVAKIEDEVNKEEEEKEVAKRDSDEDTRSSAGSEDETDPED